MEADRWRQVETLYHAASALPAAARVSFLDASCNGDHALRHEIESLLAYAGSSETFIEEPALDIAARLMARDPSNVSESRSGTTIANFDILDRLGAGGMGVVYEAVDTRLGRKVALKFLLGTVASNATTLERVEREARAASALNHPNICTIYGIRDQGGVPFIEMERLEGQTLRERILGKPIGTDTAMSLALQILDALDAAHGQGIVHRDLKPGNVFCTTRGALKILDFGVAKLDSARDAETGAVMGTVGYMSPEQAALQPVDSRTDLFSFGALFYEMVTGRAPFQGSSSAAIRDAIGNHQPIPPRRLNPAVPSALEAIILKALQKNPALRYQGASEIRNDIQRLQRRMSIRREYGLVAALVLLLALGAAVVWYATRDLHDMFANVRVQQLTHNASEDSVASGAISPDGRYVAYADAGGIHLRTVDTSETRTVPESGNLPDGVTWDLEPGWLPDGSRFVVNLLGGDEMARSSVWLIGLTGPPRRVREHAQAVAVSPLGSQIAFSGEGRQYDYPSIWLLDLNATTARKLFDADTGSSVASVSWSPDGRRISYLRADATGRRVAIETRDLAGGPASTIVRVVDGNGLQGPVWLPDGALLYSVELDPNGGTHRCDHWQVRISTTGHPIGAPRRVARWLPQCAGSFSISADGKRASYLQSATQDAIHVADLDQEGNTKPSSRRLTLTESRNIPSGWTADGRWVVFVSDSSGRAALFRQRIDADTPESITQEPGIVGAARLTPDGAWVIYRAESRRGDRLMRVPIAGGLSREIVAGRFVDGGARCSVLPARLCAIAERSADGRQLVFTSIDVDKGRGAELARFDADPAADYRWALSPDGERIAFYSATDVRIHVISLTGMPSEELDVEGRKKLGYVSWTSDGKGLLMPRVDTQGATLLSVDFHGNARVVWRQRGAQDISGIPSHDGHHVAIWVRSRSANLWMAERP